MFFTIPTLGASFGCSFPHMVFQNFPKLHAYLLQEHSTMPDPPQIMYIPKIFGFRMSKASVIGGPHANWLRWKPNCNLRSGCLKGTKSALPSAVDGDSSSGKLDPIDGKPAGSSKSNEGMEVDSPAL
jgi:hypothetical protein